MLKLSLKFQRRDIAESSTMIAMHFLFNLVICLQKRMKDENVYPSSRPYSKGILLKSIKTSNNNSNFTTEKKHFVCAEKNICP